MFFFFELTTRHVTTVTVDVPSAFFLKHQVFSCVLAVASHRFSSFGIFYDTAVCTSLQLSKYFYV